MELLCNSFTNKVAGFQSTDKFTENKMTKIYSSKHSPRRLQDMSIEDFVNVAISGFSRYLEAILENEKLL